MKRLLLVTTFISHPVYIYVYTYVDFVDKIATTMLANNLNTAVKVLFSSTYYYNGPEKRCRKDMLSSSSLSSCYQELAPGWASFIWFKYNLISGIACGFVYIILFHIFYDFSVCICVCAFVSFRFVVDCICIHMYMYMQHIHMCIVLFIYFSYICLYK